MVSNCSVAVSKTSTCPGHAGLDRDVQALPGRIEIEADAADAHRRRPHDAVRGRVDDRERSVEVGDVGERRRRGMERGDEESGEQESAQPHGASMMLRFRAMSERKSSWPLWVGLLLSVVAFGSYVGYLYRFPVTRDMPWLNLLLFAVAVVLLVIGLRRSFGAPKSTGRRVAGGIAAAIGIGIAAMFCMLIFVFSKQLPAAAGAPKVGQQAPAFALADTSGKVVSLEQLLAASPKGVILIFYRGYW
jgi:hypothetical protein